MYMFKRFFGKKKSNKSGIDSNILYTSKEMYEIRQANIHDGGAGVFGMYGSAMNQKKREILARHGRKHEIL